MAHDVLWPSIRSDYPDEIAVHMEDGRNPDWSEAETLAVVLVRARAGLLPAWFPRWG